MVIILTKVDNPFSKLRYLQTKLNKDNNIFNKGAEETGNKAEGSFFKQGPLSYKVIGLAIDAKNMSILAICDDSTWRFFDQNHSECRKEIEAQGLQNFKGVAVWNFGTNLAKKVFYL